MLGVLDGNHDGYFQKGDTAITWVFGHILTQATPDAYGEEFADFGNIEALPVIPDIWKMEVPSKAAKQFKVIKGLLAKATEVVIATDADREGEVIAREILDYCGYRKKVSRFWTSGLDTQSVKKALAAIMPGQKTENLYKEVFTALWQVPNDWKNKDGYCTDLDAAKALIQKLQNADAQVITAHTERKSTPPPLPYSLSALQKEVGKKLGLSASKVLKIAQTLYEHKITSYPRTPCQYLPKSQEVEIQDVFAAITSIDPFMGGVLDSADPNRPSRVWNDNQVNKHSHHAIIPTKHARFDLAQLNKDELAVYKMIRDRYIAQFYPDFEYDSTVIEVESCGHLFKAASQTPKVAGWKNLLGKDVSEEEQFDEGPALPELKTNEMLKVTAVKQETKKTSPPPRFTEYSLLDEMQTLKDFLRDVDDEQIRKILKSTEGLGMESTRAAIIDRLFEMGYMEKKRGKIYSTEKGRNLIARVPAIIADPITTAKWELALAGIEAGKLTLAEFMAYQQKVITELVEQAKKDAAGRERPPRTDSASAKKQAVARNEDDICPTCKEGRLRQRGFKENPEKRYWGCSRFPECKHFEWVK